MTPLTMLAITVSREAAKRARAPVAKSPGKRLPESQLLSMNGRPEFGSRISPLNGRLNCPMASSVIAPSGNDAIPTASTVRRYEPIELFGPRFAIG